MIRLWEGKRKNGKGEESPVFLYHLNRYTDLNSFDYFIHKDLKGFLSRELDYFLKHEVLSINFLSPDWRENEVNDSIKVNLLKASAIRDLSLAIIEFLGELEDFQKRMFEKKKFVVQSDYCLTLGLIKDKKLQAEIVDYILVDRDQKQVKEWKRLGLIKDKKEINDLLKAIADEKHRFNYLVIDTQLLTEGLKWKVLSSFDNLELQTNGLLVNSENFQALNLLAHKYAERLQSVYIDPPYNTNAAPIAYKNGYRHSSWLS